MTIFQTNTFLKAFATVKGDTPLFDKGAWLRKGKYFNHIFCSPWNGYSSFLNASLLEMKDILYIRYSMRDDTKYHQDQLLSGKSNIFVTTQNYAPDRFVRWSCRKAEQNGIVVEHDTIVNSYYLLKPGGLIPSEFYEILEEGSIGHTLSAKHKEMGVLATLFYIEDKHVLYLYSIGHDEKYNKLNATPLLLWTFIKEAFEKKNERIETVGGNEKRIFDFHKQFSDKVETLYNYIIPMNNKAKMLSLMGALK